MALKSFLPRGLYGRAALILIVPIVTIQLVVSLAFIQRHFEGVTRQMTRAGCGGGAASCWTRRQQLSRADALARGRSRIALPLDCR
jgi:two-component system, OmpR family, osmolarity sensor histidine kinase EnvZ